MAYTAHIEHGSLRAALINDRIDAMSALYAADGIQRTVELGPVAFFLESPILMASGVRLVGAGAGRTILRPTYTGGAADATNAAISVVGVLDTAVLNTTLSALVIRDASSIVVTSVSGKTIAAGSYIALEGNNLSSNSYADSDGTSVILREIVRASSAYVSSTTIALDGPVLQYHAAAVTAIGVVPVVDAAIEGLDINAEGGLLAVGIHASYSIGLKVTDVSGAGFSLAMFKLDHGTRDFTVDGVLCRGEANSVIFAETVMSGTIRGVRCAPNGLRTHASGTPRSLLLFRFRCTNIRTSDCTLQRGTAGLFYGGGLYLSFENILIRDMLMSSTVEALLITAGEHQNGAPLGIGIWSGYGPLALAEFARFITLSNVAVEDCRAVDNAYWPVGWLFHDTFHTHASAITISTRGIGPQVAGSYAAGVYATDAQGHVESLTVNGTSYGLRTAAGCWVVFESVVIDGVAGSPATGAIAVQFGHSSAGSSPMIKHLKVYTYSGSVRFAGDFLVSPDWGLVVEDWWEDNVPRYPYAMVAYNNTSTGIAISELAEFDPASPAGKRYVKDPANYPAADSAGMLCVLAGSGSGSDYGYGYGLYAPLPGVNVGVKCSTAVVAVGDKITSSTARQAKANNSATAGTVIGRALTNKAAGAAGTVYITPASGS